jgi:mannose-6-phosphate isomerase-like protein (cupin superfamily)
MTRYFFDLDNTLCKTNGNDYVNSIPILERIEYVNQLKKQGHTIIIWTARGSSSGKDYQELTLKQINEWKINYNELIMGKPDYDIYIDDKSFNVNTFLPIPPIIDSSNILITKKSNNETQIVEKGWGKEIIFVNNPEYCGKILCFQKGKKFSMHFHIEKKETWYIYKGKFILNWIDTEKGITHTEYLNIGDVITNERGDPHQLFALEDSELFEVSTKHKDSDSYRINKGD